MQPQIFLFPLQHKPKIELTPRIPRILHLTSPLFPIQKIQHNLILPSLPLKPTPQTIPITILLPKRPNTSLQHSKIQPTNLRPLIRHPTPPNYRQLLYLWPYIRSHLFM